MSRPGRFAHRPRHIMVFAAWRWPERLSSRGSPPCVVRRRSRHTAPPCEPDRNTDRRADARAKGEPSPASPPSAPSFLRRAPFFRATRLILDDALYVATSFAAPLPSRRRGHRGRRRPDIERVREIAVPAMRTCALTQSARLDPRPSASPPSLVQRRFGPRSGSSSGLPPEPVRHGVRQRIDDGSAIRHLAGGEDEVVQRHGRD